MRPRTLGWLECFMRALSLRKDFSSSLVEYPACNRDMCLLHATGTCVYSMQQEHLFTPCNRGMCLLHATGTCVTVLLVLCVTYST